MGKAANTLASWADPILGEGPTSSLFGRIQESTLEIIYIHIHQQTFKSKYQDLPDIPQLTCAGRAEKKPKPRDGINSEGPLQPTFPFMGAHNTPLPC